MLESININGVGPVSPLTAQFAQRMNVITGDNGLGKSFLLDVCFWALTSTWPAGRMAMPNPAATNPRITWRTGGDQGAVEFSFESERWFRSSGESPRPGSPLIVALGANGDLFAWDPHRDTFPGPERFRGLRSPEPVQFMAGAEPEYDHRLRHDSALRYSRDIAHGVGSADGMVCNGLIMDWVNWYHESRGSEFAGSPFQILDAVVSLLSHPTEPISCGPPVRLYPEDSRRLPTLSTPYGAVPYPQWSAGIKRIVHFAYVLVWAWTEHQSLAKLRRLTPVNDLVLLIDEVESHLHPRWQRSILPAILKVAELLSPDLKIQVIATTHSPLVLASLEPNFNEEQDQLFCFNFDPKAPREQMVTFDALPWVNHGDAVGWLTSDVFGLTQARSTEAEIAIEAAEAFARGELDALPPNLKTREAITRELRRVLGTMDPFWPSWILEIEQ